jgi:hypothetical protein
MQDRQLYFRKLSIPEAKTILPMPLRNQEALILLHLSEAKFIPQNRGIKTVFGFQSQSSDLGWTLAGLTLTRACHS